MVDFDGRVLGRIMAAAAVAFFFRLITGPGPALLPDEETEDSGDEEAQSDSGKVVPVTIRWSGITCCLSDKRGKTTRFLLTNVSGEAKPGRLLAIMGPSGSGKTTLLNVLAGQLAASPRLHLSGHLDINGKSRLTGGYKIAYVRQEDLFFSQLTPRETLSIAAELQLPEFASVEKRDKYVNELLFRLGLINCADSIVGDAKVRGISGGEKKRLSLACELIASPSVIFADEPTTGLDAFQAEKVMETLQQLAQEGHTVICSIHQPRSSVYNNFDDIVLLSEGSVVYNGPAKDEPLKYFAKFGYECPDHMNPAEFLADLISVDYSSAESVHSSQARIDKFVAEFSENVLVIECVSPVDAWKNSKIQTKFARKALTKHQAGWWKQFRLLLKRAWMQVAAINTAMAALTKTVSVFPKERTIIDREHEKGSYAMGPYLLSKLLAEIPIGAAFPLMFGTLLYPMARLHPSLSRFAKFCGIITMESFAASAMGLTVGAMVPTTEAAMAVGPSLMTVFIVFGGYYVNAENTPVIFKWIPHISLIRWAFQGLCINEFSGLQFEHHNSYDIETGEQALERFSFGGSGIGDTITAQGRILMFWYCITYLLLKNNKPKYQQLEPHLQSS
ncbi:ABC transporter G family member 7 isoform X2 [Dendrobium catenatum]|uniref:ABC transporter G family member 7 isoform X2 n=1 Tax=Dendrobium catenatum TaxID=906689 RepID=UPI00109F5AB1|nr:ABC transporter G family member 7 isoform X2 [Dendrobium catenatum]